MLLGFQTSRHTAEASSADGPAACAAADTSGTFCGTQLGRRRETAPLMTPSCATDILHPTLALSILPDLV